MAKQQGWGYALQAGVNGYLQGANFVKEQDRRDKADARADKADARADTAETERVEDRARTTADRQSMINASLPQQVETPNDVKMDDDGNQLPAAMPYRVGGQRYDTQDAATTAAAAANTPDAVRARQVAAMAGTGNALGAAQLESAGVQAESAKFALSAAQKARVDEDFNQSIMALGDPTAIAAKVSGSAMVGGATVTAVKTADGKNQFAMVAPDGTQKLMGSAFGDKPGDLKKAIEPYLKIDTTHKLTFLHQEDVARQQAEQFAAQQAQAMTIHKDAMAMQNRQIGASAGNAANTLSENRRQFDLTHPEAALPKAVQLAASTAASNIKLIQAAQMKDDGSNPDLTMSLNKKLASAQIQYNNLLAPFMPKADTASPAADPLGMRTPPAAAAAPGGQPVTAPRPGPAPVAAGGTGAAPRQAPAAAAQAPALPPAAQEAFTMAQSADNDVKAAKAQLMTWGAKKRAENPMGYRSAERALETAQQAQKEAQNAYERTVTPDNGAAFATRRD